MLPIVQEAMPPLNWVNDNDNTNETENANTNAISVICNSIEKVRSLAPVFQNNNSVVAWEMILDMPPRRQLQQIYKEITARERSIQEQLNLKTPISNQNIQALTKEIYDLGLKLQTIEVQDLTIEEYENGEYEDNLWNFARHAIREARTGSMLSVSTQEYAEQLNLHIPSIWADIVDYVNSEISDTTASPKEFAKQFANKYKHRRA